MRNFSLVNKKPRRGRKKALRPLKRRQKAIKRKNLNSKCKNGLALATQKKKSKMKRNQKKTVCAAKKSF